MLIPAESVLCQKSMLHLFLKEISSRFKKMCKQNGVPILGGFKEK